MTSELFEIAYATASKRLCLFTGTGFSKALTNNRAPGWQSLLESLCDLTDDVNLKMNLFPESNSSPLSLEESAQVIATELFKKDKNIHQEIAIKIKELEFEGDFENIKSFINKESFKVVTTNYDKLIEDIINDTRECHSLTPGLPIPRSQSRVKVYHVHGSVDSPLNMIVTSDDYFKFINSESYFSRKLSTILHENTVVIIGYSLSDTNLKAIISDYKGFTASHTIGSNIFFISRSKVNQYLKDYYAKCFGIRVLDELEINIFFGLLNKKILEAESITEKTIENIKNVFENGHSYKKDYIRIKSSFFEIISSISAIGKSITNDQVIKVLGDVIKTKVELTSETGAWEQYTHLAEWLIYLSSMLDIENTSIEEIFLDATKKSMTSMSKEKFFGYSWQAYQLWNNKWYEIIASNRIMISNYISKNTSDPDALRVCYK